MGGVACVTAFRKYELYVERSESGGGKICALTERGRERCGE